MEVQLINDELLSELHQRAKESERLRQNFDLRTTAEDTSQRMLNVLEPGTKVPITAYLYTLRNGFYGMMKWFKYAHRG